MQKTAHRRIMVAFGEWIKGLDDYPGWRDWNRKKVRFTIDHDHGRLIDEDFQDFSFSGDTKKQHDAVMSYLILSTSHQSLLDCQYYFRRYPFSGLPIKPATHIRYMCEMYFTRFYEFEERLENCLKAVNKSISSNKFDVKGTKRRFRDHFSREINARHVIHHEEHFDDVALDNLALTSMMADEAEIGRWWKKRNRAGYRRVAAEWAKRARERSGEVEAYLEAVAAAMLTHCSYLREPTEGRVDDAPSPDA